MPALTSAFQLSGGILLDDDCISLYRDLVLTGQALEDRTVSARHELHPLAAKAIANLASEPVRAKTWIDGMLGSGMTESNVLEVIRFVNQIGGLVVRRGLRSTLDMAVRQITLAKLGGRGTARVYRAPAGVRGIASAVGRASAPLFATAPVTLSLANVAHVISLQQTELAVAVLVTLLLSMVAHELGHVLTIKHFRCDACVIQRGLRLGIIHRKMKRREELMTSLMGPMVGAVSCLAMTAVFHMNGFAEFGLAAAILHLLSLLPWYGDGRALFNNLMKS